MVVAPVRTRYVLGCAFPEAGRIVVLPMRPTRPEGIENGIGMLVTPPAVPRITFGVPDMMVVGRLDGRPGIIWTAAPPEVAKGSAGGFALPVGVEI